MKAACQGRVLKVIIETCLLTQEEKIRLCQVVSDVRGGLHQDLHRLFHRRRHPPRTWPCCGSTRPPQVKVKAAGGIASKEDAEAFLALGADRLGTSRLVALAKEAGL